MKRLMKYSNCCNHVVRMKTKILIILLIFLGLSSSAFELDASVDEEIRKNYNPSALENSLPKLPKVQPSGSKTETSSVNKPPSSLPEAVPSSKNTSLNKLPTNPNFDKATAIRIKKGTKFKVKSSAYISDTTKKGARLSFTTLYPVTQRYITIPAGTVFKAVITDSHAPQITGNGGLIEVEIDGVNYKGYTYGAEGKITKANGKKIFMNNIKGKRGYIKGVQKHINKGENFYKKTRRASTKLANNPIGIIISPIPTVIGICVYAVNTVGSPVFAITSKGSIISIPAGSEFEIKLLDDVYLQN